MERSELLKLSTDIAYELLCCGAEIYRVEESVLRIFAAYGEEDVEVFAIPSLLIVSVRPADTEPLVQVRRLRENGTHLEKVRAYNNLCRRICAQTPPPADIQAELTRIEQTPSYPHGVIVIAYAIVAFGFTLMFGGSIFDALAALLAGAAVEQALFQMQKFDTNAFFSMILASFAAAAVSCLCVYCGLGQMRDKIIIGTLMTLVPGIALTNTMRDIMAGDLIAGVTRLITVLLTAGGIALGTGAALRLAQLVGVI